MSDWVVVSVGGPLATSQALTSHVTEQVVVWDPTSGTVLTTLKGCVGGCAPHAVASFNGRALLAAHGDKPTLTTWALQKEQPMAKTTLPERLSCLAVSPDAIYVVGGSLSGGLYIWHAATGALLRHVSEAHYKRVNAVRFLDSSDGFVSCSDDSLIHVWSLADLLNLLDIHSRGMPRFTLTSHHLPVTDLAVTSHGWHARLFSVSMDRTCRVHDLHLDGRLVMTVRCEEELSCVVVDNLEQACFVGTVKGTILKIALIVSGEAEAILGSISTKEASSGGSHNKVSAKPNSTVALSTLPYHSVLNEQTCSLNGHTSRITCLCILPSSSSNATLLVSASMDGQLIVWDAASRQSLRVLYHHKGPVAHVSLIHRGWLHSSLENVPSLMPLKRFVQPLDMQSMHAHLDPATALPVEGSGMSDQTKSTLTSWLDLVDAWCEEACTEETRVDAPLVETTACSSEALSKEIELLKKTNLTLKQSNDEMYKMLVGEFLDKKRST